MGNIMTFLTHKINKGHRVTGVWLKYESKVTGYSDVINLTKNGLITKRIPVVNDFYELQQLDGPSSMQKLSCYQARNDTIAISPDPSFDVISVSQIDFLLVPHLNSNLYTVMNSSKLIQKLKLLYLAN